MRTYVLAAENPRVTGSIPVLGIFYFQEFTERCFFMLKIRKIPNFTHLQPPVDKLISPIVRLQPDFFI